MNQMGMFDATPPRFPRHHRNDPVSSVNAAIAGEATGRFKKHAEQVLDLVRRYPNSTAAELASVAKSKHLDKHEIRRRLTELVAAGIVEQIKPTDVMKPCEVAGSRACRYVAR